MSSIFPPHFLASIGKATGFDETSFVQVHELPAPTSIRLNPAKPIGQFDKDEPVAWCSEGRYLAERPVFTLDPLFQAGSYYVQEASSMFLSEILKQTLDLTDELKVLDLCAAPGGKSTLIGSLISKDSLLVANEVIKNRSSILADNLTRWGLLNAFVTNNDPSHFSRLEGYFDVMVVDAPCSGSGLFRKDPKAMNEWSLNNVVMCAQRQKRILADAWDTLKEDGLLIYSTCSYSVEENEDILDWIFDTFEVESRSIKTSNNSGIVQTQSPTNQAFGYRFYPDKVQGEGFFTAVIQKKEGSNYPFRGFKPQRTKDFKAEKEILSRWLTNAEEVTWTAKNGDYFLLNPKHLDHFLLLQKQFYFRKAGVRLGQFQGKDLIPDHELAMSTVLKNEIPSITLNEQQALKYLKKEEIEIDYSVKGWQLVTYEKFGLGWIKVMPNRYNNYLPKEWRILMEIE